MHASLLADHTILKDKKINEKYKFIEVDSRRTEKVGKSQKRWYDQQFTTQFSFYYTATLMSDLMLALCPDT